MNSEAAMVHMSLLRGWGVCALGSVLLLAPGFARAVESTATITNFAIEVIDLDLQDGVQAGYSMMGLLTTAKAYALGEFGTAGKTQTDARSDWTSEVHAGVLDGLAGSVAHGAPGHLFAFGRTTAQESGYSSEVRRFADGITILPNTRLVFTADVHATVSHYPCVPPECGVLYAATFFHLYQRGPGGTIDSAAYYSVQTHLPDGGPDLHRHMDLSFSTGADPWLGEIGMLVTTESSVPIPEPSTGLLLLAGAGVVLWRLRRRTE
jgi:hypothetical protein